MNNLSNIQIKIFEFLKSEIKSKGIAPSIREICQVVKLSSTSTVHYHLRELEKKGYIKRDKSKNRFVEILEPNFYKSDSSRGFVNVPIVGTVAAGLPILAFENIEGYFPVSPDSPVKENCFMLRIKGDSMINAGILNDDLVLVHQQPSADNGDIVIALIDDSATCKRLLKKEDCIWLLPENDKYKPIITKEMSVIGKVVGLFRSYK